MRLDRFALSFVAGATLYSMAGSALAAVPLLSGQYVETYEAYCQSPSTALTTFSEERTNFDSSKGTYTAVGYSDKGSPPTQVHDNLNFTFSNTATTFATEVVGFSGGVTYNITYGHVISGIAQYFAGVAIDSDGCIRQLEFVRVL